MKMSSNLHPIMEMLEEVRSAKQKSKRDFSIYDLGVTEDTYSNWLNKFPSRLHSRVKRSIASVLGMTIKEVNLYL